MALPAGLVLHAAAAAPEGPAKPALPCPGLTGLAVPASAIGLPTRGATVTAARLAPEAEDGTLGEHCLVDGAVASVSASAQPIQFQAALPTHWNRKLLQLGDGGYRGSVTSPTANRGGAAMTPAPLARGYVVFGSDAGHSGNALDASFALDPEQLRNFAGEQIKKTADAVRVVVGRYYGVPVRYSYYLGGSSGGREAVTAIRDYPDDYAGAVAINPALAFTRMALKTHLIRRAMQLDDGAGRIEGAAAELLRRRVLEQCDGLDGLEDAIVSRPESCDFDFGRLRCPDGADTGPDCFSNAQVATLELMHSPTSLDYAFRGALDSLPAYTIGTDWTSPLVNLAGTGPGPGAGPALPVLGVQGLIPTGLLKFLVARDPGFDVLGFDPLRPGALRERLVEVSGLLDRVDADIGPFMERGGRLVLLHGRSDEAVPEAGTVRFYRNLVRREGQPAVDRAVRLYLVPGFGHGLGRSFRSSRVPLLAALEDWVEDGAAPADLVALDANVAPRERSRPVCRYPTWPAYDGTGDPDSAASFRCVEGAP